MTEEKAPEEEEARRGGHPSSRWPACAFAFATRPEPLFPLPRSGLLRGPLLSRDRLGAGLTPGGRGGNCSGRCGVLTRPLARAAEAESAGVAVSPRQPYD